MQNLEISTESCYQRDARMVNFLSECLELPRKSRIFGLRPKILTLGKLQIYLHFRSLIRIFAP